MALKQLDFDAAFAALTGHPPFPWQRAWHDHLAAGEFDKIKTCSLPTGLGKTSVIACWLIARAHDTKGTVPRRLVYVVNRRTVVDQSTDEARKLRENLESKPELESIKQRLGTLGISTLRGQFADNRQWSADPSSPAIIVGTVDMIGSRLLFSGYGCGFKTKPLHAGFLGQDVLLIHDEAHLEPAFQKLLDDIEKEQLLCNEFRNFRVIELSATSRSQLEPFKLSDGDRRKPEVRKRITAEKALYLHVCKDAKKLAEQIADLAIELHKDSEKSILVFARTVENIEKIADKLRKTKLQVETLTGTMRGLERDGLVKGAKFQRFLPPSDRDPNVPPTSGTVYLVCTSAGEVGVNISADHLVCDLSTFDSMTQRFGRVNRFGDCEGTRIDIIHPKEFDEDDALDSQLKKTVDLLTKLHGDGSPAALDELPIQDRIDAFAPAPVTLSTSDILFDAWALTTIYNELPGRPHVEPYLRGLEDEKQIETSVAWRQEVWELRREFANDGDRKEFQEYAAEVLEEYPLKPHELLRDRSYRVQKQLELLAERNPGHPVWLVDNDGTIEVFTLGDLADKRNKDRISYCIVLLPLEAGGLENGMLSGKSEFANDVADEWYENSESTVRRRIRLWANDPDKKNKTKGMRTIQEIIIKDSDDDSEPKVWQWFVRPRSDDAPSSRGKKEYPLHLHLDDAKCFAEQILGNLDLPEDICRAVIVAAQFHDLGKNRKVWQNSIGNPNYLDIDTAWAKSGRRLAFRSMTRYRHEFGSLHDIQNKSEFTALGDDARELVLHLIAAHHGRARPHFPFEEAFDLEPNGCDVDAIAAEVPRRFARLQRKYGRWGLAYLESLVRAADIMASQKAELAGKESTE